jgi:DNA-binding CsgD family transcriptional regulator
MDLAIQRLLPKFATCGSSRELAGLALDGARECLGAHMACVAFLDEAVEVHDRALYRATDEEFEEWDRDWRPTERVIQIALSRGVPVHSGQLFDDEAWQALPVYREYGKRLHIERYMATPIFGSRGKLAGVMNVCRRIQDGPFDGKALANVWVLAGFLSATLGRVSGTPLPGEGDATTIDLPLTPRELQVARLAARGRNNLEIALELGVARETVKQTLRRVYTKLDVRGRAPMAARLSERLRAPR